MFSDDDCKKTPPFFKRGQRYQVGSLEKDDPELLLKITTLGIIKGTVLEVSSIAPLGCPIEFKARGYNISFRKEEIKALNLSNLDD